MIIDLLNNENPWSMSIGESIACIDFNGGGDTPPTPPKPEPKVILYLVDGTTQEYVFSDGIVPSKRFQGNKNITSVTLNEGITEVWYAAFSGCTNITSVTVQGNLELIGSYSFYNLWKLSTSINFGNKLKQIDRYAFYNNAFSSIVLPDTLETIGDNVFQKCWNLSSITSNASIAPTLGNNCFIDIVETGVLTYPEGSDYSTWYDALPIGWSPEPSLDKCIVFVSEGTSVISIVKYGTAPEINIEYSTDGRIWKTYTIGYILQATPKLYFRGSGNNAFGTSSSIYNKFTITGDKVSVKGNLMSLLDYQNPPTSISGACCFMNLFNGATLLTDASELELPATVLANSCYQNMFQGCTSLTDAPQLPATTLTNNCYYHMFLGCTALETAPELPATALTQNCYNAMFQDCTSLTTAPVLQATKLVSWCYQSMFQGCTSLSSITCLATDISVSNSTSSWLKGVSQTGTFYRDANTEWTTGVNGIPEGWEVIPPYPNVFITYTDGTEEGFYFENGVIPDYQFKENNNIFAVNIKEDITTIGMMAFYFCSSLTNINLPDSLTSIGEEAFTDCQSLTSITCNAVVAPTLGSEVFSGIADEGVLTYPGGRDYSTWYDALPIGWRQEPPVSTPKVTFGLKDGTTQEYEFIDGIIPDYTSSSAPWYSQRNNILSVALSNISRIGNYAFAGSTALTTVTCEGETPTELGNYAFNGDYNITTLNLGSNVTTVGEYTFSNCNKLTSIDLGTNVTTINKNAFRTCKSCTSITYGDNVTTIGDGAFYDCNALQSVKLGKITTLTANTLNNCSGLTSLTIPSTLTTYGYQQNCVASLETITVEAGNTTFTVNGNCLMKGTTLYLGGKNAVIPDNTVIIDRYAFQGSNISINTVPASVTNLNESCFMNCINITRFSLPSGSKIKSNGITNNVFNGCKNLSDVNINNTTITSIGQQVFANCTRLNSIDMPRRITTIPSSTFNGCTSLSEFDFSAITGLRSIGTNAFKGSSLEYFDLTDNTALTAITGSAFEECRSLEVIAVPSTLTQVGNSAFKNCTSLNEIYTNDSSPTFGTTVFTGVPSGGLLRVIDSSGGSWTSQLPSWDLIAD